MSNSPCTVNLDDLLEHCADGVFVIDSNRRVSAFSKACETITGRSRETVLGMACECQDVTDCHDEFGRSLSGALCPAKQLFTGHPTTMRQRMRITRFDGRIVWVETSYSAIADDRGIVTHVVGVMRDVSEIKAREDELRALARQDLRAPVAPPPDLLPDPPRSQPAASSDGGGGAARETLDAILRRLERQHIIEALYRSRGQRTDAARALGISRSRLYRRMEVLGIDPRETESGELVAER